VLLRRETHTPTEGRRETEGEIDFIRVMSNAFTHVFISNNKTSKYMQKTEENETIL
jgi:hypothetical protein